MPLSEEYERRRLLEIGLNREARLERRLWIRFALQLAVVAFFSFVAGCVAAAAGCFRWH